MKTLTTYITEKANFLVKKHLPRKLNGYSYDDFVCRIENFISEHTTAINATLQPLQDNYKMYKGDWHVRDTDNHPVSVMKQLYKITPSSWYSEQDDSFFDELNEICDAYDLKLKIELGGDLIVLCKDVNDYVGTYYTIFSVGNNKLAVMIHESYILDTL